MPSRTPSLFSSSNVTLDPSAPGTVIRYAFALEAAGNIFGVVNQLLYPSYTLSLGVASPMLDVNSTSITLMQWLAAFVAGLTPQLLLALPNTRTAIESRPMVYWTLLAGEGFLVPLLLWQALNAGSSGLTPNALYVCAAVLAGIIPWRLYILLIRPDLMGRYLEETDKKSR